MRMSHDSSPQAPARRGKRSWVLPLATYLAVFGVLLAGWIGMADRAEPSGYMSNVEDHYLVAWIIGWVGRALVTNPLRLFDAQINYPATGQLAAIEHFLSTTIAVGPVLAVSGNAVLAANVAAILSYPLAAFCMNRLLVALGCSGVVAWVGGFAFAIGPERVPGNLLVLKYLNLYLPLVALCLTRLREHPGLRSAAWLTLALTLALLSSYYLAVIVLVVAGVWGLSELARGGPERGRFFVWAVGAGLLAVVLLVIVSIPYFARPEAQLAVDPNRYSPWLMDLVWLLAMWRIFEHGTFALALAGLAVLLVLRRGTVGVLASRGIVFTLLGIALMLGPAQILFGHEVYLPFGLLLHTPAKFFRYPFRFSVLFGFGLTLVLCATLEAVRRRLGVVAGSIAVAVLALLALEPRASFVGGHGSTRFDIIFAPIYPAVARVTSEQGGGPLLELPHSQGTTGADGSYVPRVEVQSMLGWTIHHQPLIVGYVDFPPPHRLWVERAVHRLPAGEALNDLVSMTHLRWLLLRPVGEWPEPQDRARLLSQKGVTNVLSQDGWDLLRIDREPRHPEWFTAIARGARRDSTVLGTPLEKVAPGQAGSVVVGSLATEAEAGLPFMGALTVLNVGTATWPSASTRSQRTVRLLMRWWPAGSSADDAIAVKSRKIDLTSDLAPGEKKGFLAYILPPNKPGLYDYEIKVVQGRHSAFDGPGNTPLRGRIRVVPRRHPPADQRAS